MLKPFAIKNRDLNLELAFRKEDVDIKCFFLFVTQRSEMSSMNCLNRMYWPVKPLQLFEVFSLFNRAEPRFCY